MYLAKVERLQQNQASLESQVQDLRSRTAANTTDREELQKKLHFEHGNSSRLEVDLDHARNQLQHFSKEQVRF